MTASGATFDTERHCDAMAAALELTITPEQRPGVLHFLNIAHRMATIVQDAPLDEDGFEPAPSFRPGRPVAETAR